MSNSSNFTLGVHNSAEDVRVFSQHDIQELGKMEMQAGLAKLHSRLQSERRKQSMRYWADFWPVGVGLVLAFFAPQLSDLLSQFKWGMGIMFPYVVLAGRPELHLSSSMAGILPQVILYAQFPIEGLLARSASKPHVTLAAVIGRVACFQILASTLLVLVSGSLG
jgi:hypothetical protein